MTKPHEANDARATAVHTVAMAIQGVAYGRATVAKAERAVDAVEALGWGPKPTVSRKEIERHIYHAMRSSVSLDGLTTRHFDAIVNAAAGAVLVAGIEVTDGSE